MPPSPSHDRHVVMMFIIPFFGVRKEAEAVGAGMPSARSQIRPWICAVATSSRLRRGRQTAVRPLGDRVARLLASGPCYLASWTPSRVARDDESAYRDEVQVRWTRNDGALPAHEARVALDMDERRGARDHPGRPSAVPAGASGRAAALVVEQCRERRERHRARHAPRLAPAAKRRGGDARIRSAAPSPPAVGVTWRRAPLPGRQPRASPTVTWPCRGRTSPRRSRRAPAPGLLDRAREGLA